jgi:hypothetical protein
MSDMHLYQEGDQIFAEFRHKVRTSQVLSASVERLLRGIRFSGRLSVLLQNGRVLKSGYEEGYFPNTGETAVSARVQ